MKTITVKIQEVKEGNYFISKGSKMVFSQIRKETDTHISVYVMQCIMSSYTTVTFPKNQEVELLIK